MKATKIEWWHGSRTGYVRGCRCDECRKSNALYQRRLVRRLTDAGLSDDDPRHGTITAYGAHGCRCDECREANRIVSRDYRARKRAAS